MPALALAGGLVATPAAAQVWRKVEQPLARDATLVRGQGASVRVERRWQGEGDDRYPVLAIIVEMPGLAPLEMPADERRGDSYGLRIGIGRLARADAHPVVIVEGYSGGAHCCGTFQMAAVGPDGALASLDLPMRDGDFDAAFPRDIDGDGVRDILRADDSFLYAFASYAASWSLPQVYNLVDGALVDVTARPGFAPLFRKAAAQTWAVCRKPAAFGRNGACAAYAGAMARLGKAEEGIAAAAAHAEPSDWLPEDCTVDYVDDLCPEGKERRFAGFEEALRWFLRENGYID